MAFSRISRSSNIPAKTTPKSSKSSPKSRLNPPESLPKPSPNEHFRGFCYVKKSKMSTRKVQKPFVQKEPTFCSRFAVHSIAIPQGGAPPPPNLGQAFWGKAKARMPKSKFLAFKFERPKTVVLDTILHGISRLWGHPRATWASQNPPKSSPGASKIEPGALQDAFFKRHLT